MIEQLDKDELLALLHKRCTKCGVVKYFGEFTKHNGCSGGVTSACRKCHSERHRKYHKENKEKEAERHRKYHEENKEKEAERQRKYRKENKEKVLERQRKHYEENKEKVLERHRKYHKENKEKVLERKRKWQKENPEKCAESTRKRRARKVNAAGSHTAEQVKARFDYYGNKCIYCGSDENLEVEHRIPLARGGSDWPANLAPACGPCNRSKGTKTETEFKKILEERNE
jgi:5-methylcytosine-specific restriction endonuclease McrA